MCVSVIGCDKTKNEKVIVYFIMQGINVAIVFDTHICHSFFGHLFSHCIALPLVVIDGNVYYHHDNILIFAWGGS